MNRLFIILAAIAGITGISWALRQPAPAQPGETAVGVKNEAPPCCQKSPSRMSLLRAKPVTEAVR